MHGRCRAPHSEARSLQRSVPKGSQARALPIALRPDGFVLRNRNGDRRHGVTTDENQPAVDAMIRVPLKRTSGALCSHPENAASGPSEHGQFTVSTQALGAT